MSKGVQGKKKRTPKDPSSQPYSPQTQRPICPYPSPNPRDKFGVVGLFYVSGICFLCLCCFWFYLDKRGVWEERGGGLGEGVGEICDLYEGEWVWDEGYPVYRDCGFLDQGFKCEENGREDVGFSKWRWKPKHCDLPRFDAHDMLQRLRDKRLVFVGDSIGRNQWESLLCMLSSAVHDKSSIYEVNGTPITKHDGFFVFKFKDFNCTVEYYRVPFLVPQGHPPKNKPKGVITTLQVDVMDWTSTRWKDADVLIFNTGHWWNEGKTIRSGCYFQEGKEVKMNMTVDTAYKTAINTLTNWIKQEVNTSKTHVMYRTYSPVHFSGGNWKTGGTCNKETLPVVDVPLPQPRPPILKVIDDALSKESTIDVDVLNITHLSSQRKDGHPSRYYIGPGKLAAFHRQDCSHWCLPGIPDTWNELLYTTMLNRAASTAERRHWSKSQKIKR